MTIKLVSPAGQVVTLMSRPGATEVADNGTDQPYGSSDILVATSPITFNAAATVTAENMGLAAGTIICQAAAPGDGVCSYSPHPGAAAAGNFATFVGQPIGNGMLGTGTPANWQLCIGDSATPDAGTINSVTLNVTISG
jgi:hypothetical protein